jgi:hypothetical protein
MVSVEFNRFINYYKKLETFQINLQVQRRDDRDGVKRKIMVVQQDIL